MADHESQELREPKILEMYRDDNDPERVNVYLPDGTRSADLRFTIQYLNIDMGDYIKALNESLDALLIHARPKSPDSESLEVSRYYTDNLPNETVTITMPGSSGTDNRPYYSVLTGQLPGGGDNPEWNHRLVEHLIDNGNIPSLYLNLRNNSGIRDFTENPPISAAPWNQ